MSPFSLYEQLNGFGYKISLEECEKLFEKYKSTFAPTIKWLTDRQWEACRTFKAVNINGRKRSWYAPNLAKIREKVIAELTRNGRKALSETDEDRIPYEIADKRKAHLAAIRREGANFHIQSVNADFTKRAMGRMRKAFKQAGYDVRMYNSVYDEIVLDMHRSCAQEAHEMQKQIMVEEANKMLKRVPMAVEGHLETHWTK